MILILFVFLGGVLTILSPCILPVLPFVFARAEQRFVTSGLPMLAGMAVTFAGIASLAAVGGSWAVRVNQYGRLLALVLLTAFAATLLSRHLADWLARPFVALGNRLLPTGGESGMLSAVLLGVATGLLWAPCAGPILGLVLTGAALSGPNAHTTILLFAYAAGAATSLGIAILAGGRVFALMKRSLGAGEWVRRSLGVAVLLGVFAIAMGWDSSILTNLSLAGTNRLEQSLVDKIEPHDPQGVTSVAGTASAASATGAAGSTDAATSPGAAAAAAATAAPPLEGPAPELAGATGWLNSAPLTLQALRGKVVLIDFWTYSCINCLRALPYVNAWYEKYKDHGLVVVGVHSPEFAFERDPENVKRAVHDLDVRYPVALDDKLAVWRNFKNHYWPAHYFIDADGRLRGHHYGEGDYAGSEQVLRTLLAEAGNMNLPPAGMDVSRAAGTQAAADLSQVQSGETYVGYGRAEKFASPGDVVEDREHDYTIPTTLALNQWALAGHWKVEEEKGVLRSAPGRIDFQFYARDLHLVLGVGTNGKPVRFRVLLDGMPPGANHGVDTNENGEGVVTDQRLYQLIRQSGAVGERRFSIEFLDGGVQAYSFTFG